MKKEPQQEEKQETRQAENSVFVHTTMENGIQFSDMPKVKRKKQAKKRALMTLPVK